MADILATRMAWKLIFRYTLAVWVSLFTAQAAADMTVVEKWIKSEFQPSTLNKLEQLEEMYWFSEAARPYKGMEISVISATSPTHRYESMVLAKAFREITGIKVTHVLTGEDEVVELLQAQWSSDRSIYDAWICDGDLIGTLARNGLATSLTGFMAGNGKEVTLPTLDLNDFMGKSFATGPDDRLYQLPDQQFANLYWFRYDWFKRQDLKKKFKEIYGYDLGVPLNWSAYEDIADFFTNKVQEIDGSRVYGHNDFNGNPLQAGRRFSNVWLSMAGVGDKGIPNGKPVDEWGIRENNCRPVGADITRGGAVNGPAAKYALRKFFEWNTKYAPLNSLQMDQQQYAEFLAQGHIAQQIFCYPSLIPHILAPGPVVRDNGKPKWRLAPSPHGPYWENGMKLGYQNCDGWTLLKNTPLKQRKAAWLYAQFCVAKTTSLKKTHIGLAPIRDSDINHKSFTMRTSELGGLVEFYRSPARSAWSPIGANVPDYPTLLGLWGKNIGNAVAGKVTTDQAMDNMARDMDKVLMRLTRSSPKRRCDPELNEEKDGEYWLKQSGSPKEKVNEKTQGETIDYDQLLQTWREGRG